MQVSKMQMHKIKLMIARAGMKYEFSRAELDKFKQPKLDADGNPAAETVVKLKGVYHETGSHFMLVVNEAARVSRKPQPMILTFWDSAKVLQKDDEVVVGEKQYKVTAIQDVGKWGLFADISLELIEDGSGRV